MSFNVKREGPNQPDPHMVNSVRYMEHGVEGSFNFRTENPGADIPKVGEKLSINGKVFKVVRCVRQLVFGRYAIQTHNVIVEGCPRTSVEDLLRHGKAPSPKPK